MRVTGWARSQEVQVRSEETAWMLPYDLRYCFLYESCRDKRDQPSLTVVASQDSDIIAQKLCQTETTDLSAAAGVK